MSDVSSFDTYLQEQLQDPEFRERFEAADRALGITFQLAELRRKRGLTQAQAAALMGARRQTISRLENPASNGQTFISCLIALTFVLFATSLVLAACPPRSPV
jgi:DNA-binding XRE family transcriptional regulator